MIIFAIYFVVDGTKSTLVGRVSNAPYALYNHTASYDVTTVDK